MEAQLIESSWLNDNLNNKDLIVIDATQGDVENIPKIPGARNFQLKANFSDSSSKYPNMMPSPEQFQEEVQKLGVNDTSHVVIYDNKGIYWGPRVWFMFKVMGLQNVSILNGGFPAWNILNYRTIANYVASERGCFKVKAHLSVVKDFDFISENSKSKNLPLFDARSANRFYEKAPEPRPELKSGCIPNSFSLPYGEVLNEGRYKSNVELKDIFENVKLNNEPLIFSCGSGLTACITLFAAALVLPNELYLYDGSWTEWAQRKGLFVE